MAPTLHTARLVLTPVAERDVTPPPRPLEHPPGGPLALGRPEPLRASPRDRAPLQPRPTHWSRGLATEAATAVLAYAFDTLALPEVLATTDDGNHLSLRVLTRLGAPPTSRIQVGPDTYPCFRLQRPRYAPLRPL
jgi:hypothetical protein